MRLSVLLTGPAAAIREEGGAEEARALCSRVLVYYYLAFRCASAGVPPLACTLLCLFVEAALFGASKYG